VMRRFLSRILVHACLAPSMGCEGLGWYRAAGHIPGIAATDYAFYNFCGVSSQLFQFTPEQIESSTNVALGDLGFKPCGPAVRKPDGVTELKVKTPDGRPTTIWIAGRGNNTEMKVEIGPGHLGDEELSRDLFRRVALNFGTAIRAFTPIDPTLPHRINPPRPLIARTGVKEPPEILEGEGLRPDQNRDQPSTDQQNGVPPGDNGDTNFPGSMGLPGGMPSGMNPNIPYVPFPYFLGPSSPGFDEQ
jgi:hypothetical protein